MMDQATCCGYAAALVSILAFGSFAVPIKCQAVRKVAVDPLVLQTYKVGVCFATSWLVLAWGVPFTFTPLGFVSGLLMVPGGTAGYYGVRNAGLALSQGIWSSLKVLVAFVWGLCMFHEPVRSVTGTVVAILFMLIGLTGMSYFASGNVSSRSLPFLSQGQVSLSSLNNNDYNNNNNNHRGRHHYHETLEEPLLAAQEEGLDHSMMDEMDDSTSKTGVRSRSVSSESSSQREGFSYYASFDDDDDEDAENDNRRRNHPNETPPQSRLVVQAGEPSLNGDDRDDSMPKTFLGLSNRSLGIMGAVIDGLYGGSVLVPMHFVKQKEGFQGLGFLISFAIGCWTVLCLIWLGRWAVNTAQTGSLRHGWQLLPSMHVSTVGPYATLAGVIWSIGNVCSILSVSLLGQGLGYSLVQSQLIVAGLWAVFFYGEMQGRVQIGGWFAFASLTVVSILLLTRQHESAMPMQGASSATVEQAFSH